MSFVDFIGGARPQWFLIGPHADYDKLVASL